MRTVVSIFGRQEFLGIHRPPAVSAALTNQFLNIFDGFVVLKIGHVSKRKNYCCPRSHTIKWSSVSTS